MHHSWTSLSEYLTKCTQTDPVYVPVLLCEIHPCMLFGRKKICVWSRYMSWLRNFSFSLTSPSSFKETQSNPDGFTEIHRIIEVKKSLRATFQNSNKKCIFYLFIKFITNTKCIAIPSRFFIRFIQCIVKLDGMSHYKYAIITHLWQLMSSALDKWLTVIHYWMHD